MDLIRSQGCADYHQTFEFFLPQFFHHVLRFTSLRCAPASVPRTCELALIHFKIQSRAFYLHYMPHYSVSSFSLFMKFGGQNTIGPRCTDTHSSFNSYHRILVIQSYGAAGRGILATGQRLGQVICSWRTLLGRRQLPFAPTSPVLITPIIYRHGKMPINSSIIRSPPYV